MAGILANSSTAQMVEGDTAADKSVSGYLAREEITLSTTGTPTTRQWGLATPTGSAATVELSDDTAASPTFTPDVEGYYVVTCILDGSTAHDLRIAVFQVSNVSTLSAVRLLPVADATIPTPATGATLFYSSDQNAIAAKYPNGSISTVDVTAVP